MNKTALSTLPQEEQEKIIKNHGQLVEAEDDYSYRLLYYLFDEQFVELMYDNETDSLVSITFVDNTLGSDRASKPDSHDISLNDI